MIPFSAVKAPSSYGKVKSKLFYLGVGCYMYSAKSRKAFDALSRSIGEIAMAFDPNYRLGEIRQAIQRKIGLEDVKPKAIASDLKFNQPLEQTGISENMRHSLAWEFIVRNVSGGFRGRFTFFFAKNMAAAFLAAISHHQFGILNHTKKYSYAFVPLTIGTAFLIGSGIFIGRSICDWIRSNNHCDLGIQYLLRDPFSQIRLTTNYYHYKEDWSKREQVRFIARLARFDPNLAAHLRGEKKGN
jgi:hypothetical protein